MGALPCKESWVDYADNVLSNSEFSLRGNSGESPWYLHVKVDEHGCRKFPRLPDPGTHPRLMFTESEIPALIGRYTDPAIGDILQKNALDNLKMFRKHHASIEELSTERRLDPDREVVDRFFVKDATRNSCLLTTFIHAFLTMDTSLVDMVIEAVLFHARVVLKSKTIAVQENIVEKPYDIWHTTHYDMTTGYLFGGAEYGLLYDLLFSFLSESERSLIRESIACMTRNRRTWGMELPCRRIQSNWAPYHGDLLVLLAAIEGEDGFDSKVFSLFEDVLLHFLDYSIYDSGHAIEDAYNPNLAMREGSAAFLVLARRGFNLFRHPHYIKMWKEWMPFALEPHRNGEMYGGSSGSSFIYPASVVFAKYMYPKDPTIDFVYRHYLCQNDAEHARLGKLQTRWQAALFALPAGVLEQSQDLPAENWHDAEELNLPLTFYCNNRGKIIMRSDWTEQASCFTLDARPDGFLLGHDAPSRGAFVFSACGRVWGRCPEWMHFKESTDYSLLTVDGMCQSSGQRPKAPQGHITCYKHGRKGSTFASANLTYAYNWEWTQWAKPHVDMSLDGWEREPHDPRDFGMTAWWLPAKLYDERNVGFVPLNQWRRRFNNVDKVTRSSLMVRGASQPFVIVADDATRDYEEHEYAWCMTTPDDIDLQSFDGMDAILEERAGKGRRLLIRLLTSMKKVECKMEDFSQPNARMKLCDGTRPQIPARRLKIVTHDIMASFRILLFPLPPLSDSLPTTSWDARDGKILTVRTAQDDFTRIEFATNPVSSFTEMTVSD